MNENQKKNNFSYLAIFRDYIEEIRFNETVIKLDNGRMIEMLEQICFIWSINCLIWLQIPNENFLCHFPDWHKNIEKSKEVYTSQ